MIQLTEAHFEYGDVKSSDYHLMFANIDTSANTALGGQIKSSTIFNNAGINSFFIGYSYGDSQFSTEVEIVTDNLEPISLPYMREIEKWLFYTPEYRKLYFDIDDDCDGSTYEIVGDDVYRVYLKCRFTNPVRIEGNGGVIGYKAILESDSPVAWIDPMESTFTFDGGEDFSDVFQVSVDTDVHEYLYPRMTIQVGDVGGSITISNNTDDESRLTTFTGVPSNSQIVMDGNTNYLSDQFYSRFSNKNFVRLLDGTNSFGIVGDIVSVRLEWSSRRWL